MKKIIIAILACFLLLGALGKVYSEYIHQYLLERLILKLNTFDEKDVADCTARGGTMSRGGPDNKPFCFIKYSDARQPCTSSKECQGRCLVDRNAKELIGYCKENNAYFGCWHFIEDVKNEGLESIRNTTGTCID